MLETYLGAFYLGGKKEKDMSGGDGGERTSSFSFIDCTLILEEQEKKKDSFT